METDIKTKPYNEFSLKFCIFLLIFKKLDLLFIYKKNKEALDNRYTKVSSSLSSQPQHEKPSFNSSKGWPKRL